MGNEGPVKGESSSPGPRRTTRSGRRELRAREEDGPSTSATEEERGTTDRTEHMAVIGSGDVADLVSDRARRAGWGVQPIPLFPSEHTSNSEGLGDRCPPGLADATIIVVTTPASAHPTLSVLLANGLRSDAVVLLLPGQVGGALELAHSLALRGTGPIIAETSWSPWIRTNDDVVEVARVPLATVPSSAATDVSARIAPLFVAEPAPSVLWTALHAPDVVLRTIPLLLAAAARPADSTLGALLSGPAEGLVVGLEDERQAVARALGLTVPRLGPWLSEVLGTAQGPLTEALGPLAQLTVPDLDDARWLADLAPYGLVPLASIAATLGIDAPCATGMSVIAGHLLGNDYLLGGRTAERMGIQSAGLRRERAAS